MKKYTKEETEFAKNLFANKDGLYNEKASAKTKDEEAEEAKLLEAARKEQEKWDKINEEAEYLGTISNIQWFIYPFFKLIEALVEKTFGCCKSSGRRIPASERQEFHRKRKEK